MTDRNAALVQQVLSQLKRDVETDDFWRRFEIAEGA